MFRGIRIALFFVLAIVVGYCVVEMTTSNAVGFSSGHLILLLAALFAMGILGWFEFQGVNPKSKRHHRFSSSQSLHNVTSGTGGSGSNFYAERPRDDAWRVRKSSRRNRRRSKKS